jgi:hypothetical protein
MFVTTRGSLGGRRIGGIAAIPVLALLLALHYGLGIGNFGLAQPSDAAMAVKNEAAQNPARYGDPASASCSLRSGGTEIFGYVLQTSRVGSIDYACQTTSQTGTPIPWCVTYIAGNGQTPFVTNDACSP